MYSDASKKKSFLQNQGGPQAQARAREESEKRAREEQKVAKAAKARAERAALRGNFRAEAVAAAFDELIGSGGDDEEPMEQRPSSIKGKDLEKKPKEAAKSKKSKDRARDMAKTVRDASDGPERKPPYVESGRSGEWTDSDQQNFVLAFKEHGRDWKVTSS